MGINMNYSLLLENSKFEIPSYTKCYKSPVVSEGHMLRKIVDYRLSIQESLDNIKQVEITDHTAVTDAINTIRENFIKIKNDTSAIRDDLLGMIHQLYTAIENDKHDYNSDPKMSEILLVLEAINRKNQLKTTISNISNYPISDFPNVSFGFSGIIGEIKKSNRFDTMYKPEEVDTPEGFVSKVDNLLDEVLTTIFGKYEYDKNDLNLSIIQASEKEFGPTVRMDTEITPSIFAAAYHNLLDKNNVLDRLKKLETRVSGYFGSLYANLDSLSSAMLNPFDKIPNNYSVSMSTNIGSYISDIKDSIVELVNAISIANSVIFKFVVNAINRLNQIYNPNPAYGDSAKVVEVVLDAYKKATGVVENKPISGLQAAQEAMELMDTIEGLMAIFDESCESTNSNEIQVLNEADDAPQQNTTVNNTTDPFDLSKIIAMIGNLIDKFKNRIKMVLELKGEGITDPMFWNKNRDSLKNISQAGFGDTTVNQWFEYVIPNFEISLVENFDMNNDYNKSDEAFENHIVELFNGKHKSVFDNNDKFNDKIQKCFYDRYIESENGSYARDLVNPNEMFKFVDDIITKKWNGTYLGSIENDWKALNTQKENISRNKQQLINQYSDTHQNQNTNQQQQQASTGEPQREGGNNGIPKVGGESAIEEDDFRFNLAEHFCLPHNKHFGYLNEDGEQNNQNQNTNNATNNNEAKPSQAKPKVEVDGQSDNYQDTGTGNGRKDSANELKDLTGRYIKITGKALTAKSTVLFAAYKQYMFLYKAIRGGETIQDKEEAEQAKQKRAEEKLNQRAKRDQEEINNIKT